MWRHIFTKECFMKFVILVLLFSSQFCLAACPVNLRGYVYGDELQATESIRKILQKKGYEVVEENVDTVIQIHANFYECSLGMSAWDEINEMGYVSLRMSHAKEGVINLEGRAVLGDLIFRGFSFKRMLYSEIKATLKKLPHCHELPQLGM